MAHGIRNNKPFIFTHAGLKEGIDARFQTIMASFDGSEVEGGSLNGLQD